MASKPQPQPQPHPYHPLPSEPHRQPDYYIVLPVYPPSARRRRLVRRIAFCAGLLLAAAVIFVLWPSDPYLQVVRLRLDRIRFRTRPTIDFDISIGVRVKVRNPDLYSLEYESLDVAIGYRGNRLGFVNAVHGRVRARSSSYVDVTLDLDGVEVIFDAIYLIEDLARGVVPFDTVTEIRGKLGLFFFELPLQAKMSCEIGVNARNQTIVHQNCLPQ